MQNAQTEKQKTDNTQHTTHTTHTTHLRQIMAQTRGKEIERYIGYKSKAKDKGLAC